jgi:hypothetical protein
MQRVHRLALGLLAVFPVVAVAEDNPAFTRMKDSAEPLSALGPFLEKYVGECGDAAAAAECKANAKSFRASANGKRFYMIVPEDSASMIAPGASDGHTFTLNVTPFFPGGAYALTLGAPKKVDAAGNPVLPLVYVKAKIPDGFNAGSMARLVGMRALRLQLVFTPQDVWTLQKKGGGKAYGIRAKIEGLLVTVGRTGEELALWSGR